MRKDRRDGIARFKALIAKKIAHAPFEYQGENWVRLPQPQWCEELHTTDRTLREWAKAEGIVRRRIQTENEGTPVLYRLGDAPSAPEHLASIMGKIYREKYGLIRLRSMQWGCLIDGKEKEVYGRRQYGCLIGLAELWPAGEQIAIFKTVLHELPAFMTGVHQIEPDPDGEGRFYEWLPITLLRKHWQVAVQVHGMKVQEGGEAMSASLAAAYAATG
jgi:hypothetical protein